MFSDSSITHVPGLHLPAGLTTVGADAALFQWKRQLCCRIVETAAQHNMILVDSPASSPNQLPQACCRVILLV